MGTKAFFSVRPVTNTLQTLFEHIQPNPKTETVATADALGRVLASAPKSPTNLPTFIRSTMDGYAVRASDTFGASGTLPAYLTITDPVHMGEAPTHTVHMGEASAIHTGGMLPDGADAVVMIERTQSIGDNEIELLAPVAPGENLVQVGEDVAAGAPVLPTGHTLRPQDIGGLLAVGITEVEVVAPITVAIMGSGDEIIPPDQTPAYGQIRDINSYTISALCESIGARVIRLGIADDDFDAIRSKAEEGIANAEVLIISAGSSVSTRDYTRDTINTLGIPGILQHGLAVKPGKPAIIAACNGKPVIGLPGNPVSALLVARQVVLPTIAHMQGKTPDIVGTVQATLTANVSSTTGREDTIPVKLHKTATGYKAEPIFGKSNLIFTLVNADGIMTVPLDDNGLKSGSLVDVIPF
ncbi:MAG: gephyrin-like molybdotransferase Glp [Chloroflexota bacterium]